MNDSGRSENNAGPSGSATSQASVPRWRSAVMSACNKFVCPMNCAVYAVCGTGVDFARAGDLLEFSGAQEGDAVGHHHGFFLIVGDKDKGDADFALQRFKFDLHLAAEVGVERGERFIEEKQARTIYQGASQGDALLLAAADF